MTKRFKATVEYDGTGFAGYQRQRQEFRTVQGEIEKSLWHISKETIRVLAAGRTDSGVHATGQVIAFDMVWRHGVIKLIKALNANLPDDIVVSELSEAEERFHPRFDAKRRAYQYFIEDCSARPRKPLNRNQVWQVFSRLDDGLMNEAASHLLGQHNFATFGTPPQGNNTVREVFQAQWLPVDNGWVFTIEANAFLYRMVRSIVGSLKQVGEQRWTVEEFIDAFKAGDRSRSAAVAPAHGLYLVSVSY